MVLCAEFLKRSLWEGETVEGGSEAVNAHTTTLCPLLPSPRCPEHGGSTLQCRESLAHEISGSFMWRLHRSFSSEPQDKYETQGDTFVCWFDMC